MKRMVPSLRLILAFFLICHYTGTAQQRFLKILGQRPAGSTNTSLSALEPRIGPFNAGIPTTATIVAALVDETGAVVSTENRLRVELFVSSPNDGFPSRYIPSCSQSMAVATKGTFEFTDLRVHGVISTSLTLNLYQLHLPNAVAYPNLGFTSATFSLHGGAAFMTNWVKLKNGKYALPGRGFHTYEEAQTKPFEGMIPNLQVGSLVKLNNPDTTDYNVLAVKVFDLFGNIALSTICTISIAGGKPSVNPILTPLFGHRAISDPVSGIATFPDFQVMGVTSNNVQFSIDISTNDLECPNPFTIRSWWPAAYARVNLIAGKPVAVAPVIIPDPFNTQENVRVPSMMFAGRWTPTFYAQTVDEYGNRVSGDPNDPKGGYNGGVATISFPAPGVPIPNPDGSTTAVVNSLHWSASGTTATAVRGLYTFNSFIPNPPASIMPFDVIMQISDPALTAGSPHPISLYPGAFKPIPATTTASTTVSAVPRISIVAESTSSLATASGGNLTLYERRATVMGTDSSSGKLVFRRPIGASPFPAIIGYTLSYRDSAGKALPNSGTPQIELPVPLPAGASAELPTPMPVAINSLQGDLSPKTRAAVGFAPVNIAQTWAPNAVTLAPGVASQDVHFTARWSDQVYPVTPARQGKRTVRVEMLPDAAGTVYDVETTASVGIVTLEDPRDDGPIILNAAPTYRLCPGETGLFDLEALGYHYNGKPKTMFFSNNYYRLQYSARSSDEKVVRASIIPRDEYLGIQPTLWLTRSTSAQDTGQVQVEVTVTDLSGKSTTATIMIGCVTALQAQSHPLPEWQIHPNPTTDYTTLEWETTERGMYQVRLFNLLGVEVWHKQGWAEAGESKREVINTTGLAVGFYLVELQMGSMRGIQRLLKLQ